MPSRIALIHAVAVAIAPVEAAFRELWPEAECTNLLDDSLSGDRERDGALTAAMTRRIAVWRNMPLPPTRTAFFSPVGLSVRRSRRRRLGFVSPC
jgi:hypothetical protein